MPISIAPQNYEAQGDSFNPVSGYNVNAQNLIFTLSEETNIANLANITREDPLKNMNYVLGFVPFADAVGTISSETYWYGFATMSGMKWSVEKVGYRESADDNFEHSSPGKGTFDPIILKKGVGTHTFLYKWARRIIQVNAKDDQVASLPQASTNFYEYRCHHIKLIIRDSGLLAAKAFKIYNPWAMSFELGELDSMGNDVLFETLEVGHEGFQQFAIEDYDFGGTVGVKPTPNWGLPIGF